VSFKKSLRIQKILAHLGYGSRRTIEDWIRAGRIKCNDRVATLGDCVDLSQDRLTVDGNLVVKPTQPIQPRLLLYHKPIGEICSHADPRQRKTIFDTLPSLLKGRWISIGRLDLNTSGLLLLTNDGDIANKYMHPSRSIEREYAVRVLGKLTPSNIKNLTHGINLRDGKARFEHIIEKKASGVNHWYQVVVMEGRNRIVRRLFEAQGFLVNRLVRVRFGQLVLPANLKPGKYQELPINTKI